MIALHHYSQGMVVNGSHNPIYQIFSTQAGWLGVAIFFFLSGYGLQKSEMLRHLDLISFFQKRLIKTYLPAVLVSFLWSVYLIIWGGESLSWHFLGGTLWNFNDGVMWFVRAIVKLYIAFYVLNSLSQRFSKLKYVFFLLVTTLALFWINAGFVHSSSVILFFVGMTLAEYESWYMKIISKVYPVIVLYVILIVLGVVNRLNADWIHLLVNYFVILTSIIFLAKFDIHAPKSTKWMGDISYDIYLVHNKALMLIRHNYSFVPLWMFFILTLVLVVAFQNIRQLLKL